MGIIAPFDAVQSLGVTGQLGFTNGFGRIRYGYNFFGLLDDAAGIYQRVLTLAGKETIQRSIFRPTNPQTGPQQAWRGVFRAGVAAYHALTDAERLLLLKKARTRGMTGFNLFVGNWLQSHRT